MSNVRPTTFTSTAPTQTRLTINQPLSRLTPPLRPVVSLHPTAMLVSTPTTIQLQPGTPAISTRPGKQKFIYQHRLKSISRQGPCTNRSDCFPFERLQILEGLWYNKCCVVNTLSAQSERPHALMGFCVNCVLTCTDDEWYNSMVLNAVLLWTVSVCDCPLRSTRSDCTLLLIHESYYCIESVTDFVYLYTTNCLLIWNEEDWYGAKHI